MKPKLTKKDREFLRDYAVLGAAATAEKYGIKAQSAKNRMQMIHRDLGTHRVGEAVWVAFINESILNDTNPT